MPPRELLKKNGCSPTKYIILNFAALCFNPYFLVFSEKLMAVLLKNGHFQNVHFLIVDKQIIIMFYVYCILSRFIPIA